MMVDVVVEVLVVVAVVEVLVVVVVLAAVVVVATVCVVVVVSVGPIASQPAMIIPSVITETRNIPSPTIFFIFFLLYFIRNR
jgi:hypothetical protein